MRIQRKFVTGKLPVLIGLLIVVNALFLVISIKTFVSSSKAESSLEERPKEIVGILQSKTDKQKSVLYTQLIERVGPEQAQEELYRSGITFDGTSHLLNHTVGDWLYKKYGEKGLVHCKDYFLSSCYHGFLINVISSSGLTHLNNVMQSCWQIGKATATQCAHAIGHGLLAWDGYANLPKALSECDSVSKLSPDFPTYNCYDGVFMENNWAVHNDGKTSPDRWYKASEPTYPCYDTRISESYRKACWSNQPQMVYRETGSIEQGTAICADITNTEYKATCYDSIARQIQPLVQNDTNRLLTYCDKMPVGWKNACVISVAKSYFSLGDHVFPLKICSLLLDAAEGQCYLEAQYQFNAYVPSLNERGDLCSLIPDKYKERNFCPMI